ncbi:Hsp20/alpha crystallin family protein [Teladorsagia circumcincta]|uniref:Hsp20/alpha crystallin family protein n=1 Tax=Teladorsagia circumcincta TaxID=45464 RepID=A0A2G9UW94_TELCI|nr:Hsp20/alpha crystallin family protein [Teladorsagia circumcincta]
MELWCPYYMLGPHQHFGGVNRLERALNNYWKDADHSIMHVANETQQLVDDDKKFGVSLDVSQFRPEEVQVHLEGRNLIVEGKQQHKSDSGYMERSFLRTWTLPENVNLEAVRTQLNDNGHLCIEAPKVTETSSQRRAIPIERAPSKK